MSTASSQAFSQADSAISIAISTAFAGVRTLLLHLSVTCMMLVHGMPALCMLLHIRMAAARSLLVSLRL